jgi:hypothetical protein
MDVDRKTAIQESVGSLLHIVIVKSLIIFTYKIGTTVLHPEMS